MASTPTLYFKPHLDWGAIDNTTDSNVCVFPCVLIVLCAVPVTSVPIPTVSAGHAHLSPSRVNTGSVVIGLKQTGIVSRSVGLMHIGVMDSDANMMSVNIFPRI